MNRDPSAGLAQTSAGYRGAKRFPFAQKIRMVLMFFPVGARAGPRLERMHFRQTPWLLERYSKIQAVLTPLRGMARSPLRLATQRFAADRLRRVRQLAHDQEVLGAHRLLGERHSYENPRRCLARGSGMEEGARWAGVNQC